jgi:hypothetical protein
MDYWWERPLREVVNDPKCGSSHGMRNEMPFLIEVPSQASLMLRLFADKASQKPLPYENGEAEKIALKPNYC